MDEEISIINSNSRNDKIKNFIFDNKNKIISSIIIILIEIKMRRVLIIKPIKIFV